MAEDASAPARAWCGEKLSEPVVWGPAWFQAPSLTFGHLGSHFVWSILNARAALFLMRLGLAKSASSVVLIAGPLSGLLVQPVVGILSDQCTHAWGRRRPYLLGGLLLCLAALGALGTASWVVRVHGGPTWIATCLGILGIVGIDISVNALSAAHRALMLDMLGSGEQERVNAWATRFGSLGSVLGYFVGEMQWGGVRDQLVVLTATAAVLLVATHMSLFVLLREARWAPVLRAPASFPEKAASLFVHLFQTGKALPPPVWDLFKIQFCCWLAWFPVLYFSSAWVAEIYQATLTGPARGPDTLSEAARRAGSHALLCYALAALGASIVLPWLLHGTRARQDRHAYTPAHTVWSADEGLEPSLPVPSDTRAPSFVPRPRLGLRAPTLAEAWLGSQLLFCVTLLFFTCPVYAARSVHGAVAVVGVLGVCWALTLWAPYALLGMLLNKDDAFEPPDAVPLEHHVANPRPREASAIAWQSQAGTVMGLHNWSIVLPQLTVSLVSSLCTCFSNQSFCYPTPYGTSRQPRLLTARASCFVLAVCARCWVHSAPPRGCVIMIGSQPADWLLDRHVICYVIGMQRIRLAGGARAYTCSRPTAPTAEAGQPRSAWASAGAVIRMRHGDWVFCGYSCDAFGCRLGTRRTNGGARGQSR